MTATTQPTNVEHFTFRSNSYRVARWRGNYAASIQLQTDDGWRWVGSCVPWTTSAAIRELSKAVR